MITFPLYHMVAATMQRLGIQPINPAEGIKDRRDYSPGRRASDGFGSFLIQHFLLDVFEILAVLLVYAILHS